MLAVGSWLLLGNGAAAQETNYWTEQYGARSMLLCGAVSGSVNDMSAVYYNPGALGYLEQPEVVLSANAFQLRRLTIKDGAGEGIDLGTTDFNPIPNLFAGAVRFNFHGRNRLAYSVLSRYRFDARVQESLVGEFDLNPDVPGEEAFAGGVVAGARVSDTWIGLTWARAARRRVGLGVSTFFSIRNQKGQNELIVQAQDQTGATELYLAIDNFEASTYSLLWKFGLGFDFRPLTAGITVTTPNVRIAGSGTTTLNETVIGIDRDGDGLNDDGFTTDIQKNARANFKSPLSVGVGAGWRFKNSKIHVAAEWFNKVGAYEVLVLEPFTAQGSGEVISRTLRQKLDSVVNFAVGFEHDFSKAYTFFTGFNTDQSAYNRESQVAATAYDIYHAAVGGKVSVDQAQFTLGVRYSWGSQTIGQQVDLNPSGEGGVIDPGRDVVLDYRQLAFLIGFAFNI